jgi:hypothetical protein
MASSFLLDKSRRAAAPSRHVAAIGWTYNLLGAFQRRQLRRIAVLSRELIVLTATSSGGASTAL